MKVGSTPTRRSQKTYLDGESKITLYFSHYVNRGENDRAYILYGLSVAHSDSSQLQRPNE